MNRRTDCVSGFEWGMSICCFAMGTVLRSVFITYLLDNESWMAGIIGAVLFLPMTACYLALLRRYPGMNLFEIVQSALGRVFGQIVNIALVLYYISLACLNMMELGSFITGYLIRGTPFLVVTVAAGAAAAYALRKGMTALMRLIPSVLMISCALMIISALQSIPEADFSNLLPLFARKPGEYGHAALISLAVPYGESMTMFALAPMVRPGDSLKRPMLWSVLFTMVTIIVVHARDATVLGAMLQYVALPSFEVYRMIDVASSFTRTESLNAMVLAMLAFIKVTILLYTVAKGVAHVVGMKSEKPIALLVCMFMAVYAAAFHLTPYNNIEWALNVTPLIWMICEYAVPLALLGTGWLRGARVKGEAAA